MDLDELKEKWNLYDRKLDQAIRLNETRFRMIDVRGSLSRVFCRSAMSGAKVDEAFSSLIKSIYEKAVLQHVYKSQPAVGVEPTRGTVSLSNGRTASKAKKECCN